MKTEVLRIISDWLEHATYGVNARLDDVPLDGADVRPDDVIITNAADDQRAALQQAPTDPDELPSLQVMLYPSPIEQSVPANRPFPPDAQVDVVIRYTAKDSNTAKGIRDESITLRAVRWSLGKFFTTAPSNAARNRNSVQVWNPESMRILTFDAPIQDSIMTGAVLISVRVRDLNTLEN